jgi:hypothetical protein
MPLRQLCGGLCHHFAATMPFFVNSQFLIGSQQITGRSHVLFDFFERSGYLRIVLRTYDRYLSAMVQCTIKGRTGLKGYQSVVA